MEVRRCATIRLESFWGVLTWLENVGFLDAEVTKNSLLLFSDWTRWCETCRYRNVKWQHLFNPSTMYVIRCSHKIT